MLGINLSQRLDVGAACESVIGDNVGYVDSPARSRDARCVLPAATAHVEAHSTFGQFDTERGERIDHLLDFKNMSRKLVLVKIRRHLRTFAIRVPARLSH